MKKDLYIVGAGGFGKEVLFTAQRINAINKIWANFYFIDDALPIGNVVRGVEIVGTTDFFSTINEDVDVVIPIANNKARLSIFNKINNRNINFPNIVDPSSVVVEEGLDIGYGNIVMLNTVISTDITIGNFNIVNSYASFGHDVKIGSYNLFNPRVAISGNVSIGDYNMFGLCSAIIQNKTVGSNNQIWSNTTIFRNIKDNNVYFGIPAKKIMKND